MVSDVVTSDTQRGNQNVNTAWRRNTPSMSHAWRPSAEDVGDGGGDEDCDDAGATSTRGELRGDVPAGRDRARVEDMGRVEGWAPQQNLSPRFNAHTDVSGATGKWTGSGETTARKEMHEMQQPSQNELEVRERLYLNKAHTHHCLVMKQISIVRGGGSEVR